MADGCHVSGPARLPMRRLADGRLYVDVPGVLHCVQVPQVPRVCVPRAPRGWVSSREAAVLLGVSVRAARKRLLDAGVRCVLAGKGRVRQLFWQSAGVRVSAGRVAPLVDCLPRGWCCAQEACLLLGCSRSTLHRWGVKGWLQVRFVRLRKSGVAPWTPRTAIFRRSQVEGLRSRYEL